MKKSFLLAAACGAAIIAGNSAAQTTPEGAAAQTDNASMQGSASADAEATADVVVTGFRASLQSAAAQKRDSDAILDAIVAEDIGKLPDNNAAEAIARITGVQVSRSGDDTTGVLIRGLPNVTTTFDGREIYTAENRSVALRDFPAGALAGLEVYKSGTANILEAGLAGLINVRSRKPFDFDGLAVAGAMRGTYNDQSKKFDPNGNLLISNRWETPIGDIGVLVNFSYVQQQYQNAVRYDEGNVGLPNNDQVITPTSVGRAFYFPGSAGLYYSGGKRVRPSINGTVQWKPNPDLEVYAQGLWQAYRGDGGDDQFNVNLRDRSPVLSNVVLVQGEVNKAAGLTATGGRPATSQRSATKDYTNTYQGAFGFNWQTGRAKISSDFAYTYSVYGSRSSRFQTQFLTPQTTTIEFERNGGASFDISGVNVEDPASYRVTDYMEGRYKTIGSGLQWRGDVELETDWPILETLQFGLRATTRKASKREGSREMYLSDSLTPALLNGLQGVDLALVPDGFRGNVQPFQNFLLPTRASLRGDANAIRGYLLPYLAAVVAANPNDAGYAREFGRFQRPDVVNEPRRGFNGEEQSYAAYIQAKYNFDVGFPVDGLVGVRVVNTAGKHVGVSSITDALGNETFNVDKLRQNYLDILPNVSARLKFTPEIQMRLGFTETRTRPEFGQLTPSFTLSRVRDQPGIPSTVDYTGSGGNPRLVPLTSKNYDASLEYYFSKNGSASVAVFYRDLFGFIGNYPETTIDPVYGRLQINVPKNAGAGKLKGVEAQVQSFFDFLPGFLGGFGAQANVTYLDGKNSLPSQNGEQQPLVTITGISKWTYNLTGFYEKGPLSARLSYNRRSDFINSYSRFEGEQQFSGEATRALSRLDFSLSYSPIVELTFTFDVSNILAQPFENYRYYNPTQYFPRDVRDEGRYFGFGARFRFGAK